MKKPIKLPNIARNIIARTWVDKAINEGLITREQAKHFRTDLTLSTANLNTVQLSRFYHGWYEQISANRFKAKAQSDRWQQLSEMTQPNMSGFFPEYTAGDKHSFRTITAFDTETSDSNRLLEIAGINVIWNETKQRFERAGTEQFNRFYIPKNLDKDIVKTFDIHGYDTHGLEILRTKQGAQYSKEWNKQELQEFLKGYAKKSVLVGHNIRNADLSWIHGLESGGFELRGREEKFKHSFLDTLDLAESIFGKSPVGAGLNKLQNIASRMGVSASQLGLPAHEGWADVIVNIKVLEKIFQQFPTHPAVQEYKAALNSRKIVHSHRWSQPDPTETSHTGFVTHSLRAPVDASALKVSVGDFILNGLGVGISEYEDALKNSGSFNLNSWEEEKLSDQLLDEETKEALNEYVDRLNAGKSATSESDKIKDIVRALKPHLSKTGAGWDKPVHRLTKTEQKAVNAVLKNRWSSSWSSAFQDKVVGRALQENYIGWSKAQDKLEETRAALLDKYSGRYFGAKDYSGQTFYQEFANRKDVSRASIDVFKESIKAYERKQGYIQRRRKDVSAARADLAGRGGLTRSQRDDLYSSTIMGTRKYREELEKLNAQNTRALNLTQQMRSAGISQMYNPQQVYTTFSEQYGSIMSAGRGILPSWAEKPLARTAEAYKNAFNASSAGTLGKYNRFTRTMGFLGSIGNAAMFINPAAGLGINAVAGIASYASGLFQSHQQENITKFGQAVSMRLNLLASVIQSVTTPLKVFGGLLVKVSKSLANIWSTQYGYPLTALSGVSSNQYANMVASDRLFGFEAGTQNRLANSWASAQTGLYGMGQLDTNRLVASALLGQFSNVYAAPGGEGSAEQIANVINGTVSKIKANPRRSQYYMGLAERVNPELPNMIQTMLDMNVSDYRQLTSGSFWRNRGVWTKFLDDGSEQGRERTRFRLIAGEFGAGMQTFQAGLSRLAAPLWEKVGKPTFNAGNQILDLLADGLNSGTMQWNKIRDIAKNWAKQILSSFADENGEIHIPLGDIWNKVSGFLRSGIQDVFASLAEMMLNGFETVIEQIKAPLAKLMDDLSNIYFNTDVSLIDIITGQAKFSDMIGYAPTAAQDKAAAVLKRKPKKRGDVAIWGTDLGRGDTGWHGGSLATIPNLDLNGEELSLDLSDASPENLERARAILQALSENADKWGLAGNAGGITSFLEKSVNSGYIKGTVKGTHAKSATLIDDFKENFSKVAGGVVDSLGGSANKGRSILLEGMQAAGLHDFTIHLDGFTKSQVDYLAGQIPEAYRKTFAIGFSNNAITFSAAAPSTAR